MKEKLFVGHIGHGPVNTKEAVEILKKVNTPYTPRPNIMICLLMGLKLENLLIV